MPVRLSSRYLIRKICRPCASRYLVKYADSPQTMQHSDSRGGHDDIVLVAVSCQHGVIGLDVEFEVLVQLVRLEEGDDGHGVVVVLMTGGLLRLRLDQKLTFEADLLLVR